MNKEIIHVHIYEPHRPSIFGKASKNERSELHIYTCKDKENCDAYKNGTCINVGNVFGSRCPVGSCNKSSGYTQRARKYLDQIRGWKDQYKDAYQSLKPSPKRITKVSGGWMLPYSHINMNEEVPFESFSGLFSNGSAFIKDEDMNADNLQSIVNFIPQAFMGGAISSYQKEVVPKFIHDFKTYYPKVFNEISSDKISARIESIDFVGRKAYLRTVKPDVEVIISKKKWHWDGTKLTKTDSGFMIFDPCEWDHCYAEFIPKHEATIIVSSNDQVTDTTKFAD